MKAIVSRDNILTVPSSEQLMINAELCGCVRRLVTGWQWPRYVCTGHPEVVHAFTGMCETAERGKCSAESTEQRLQANDVNRKRCNKNMMMEIVHIKVTSIKHPHLDVPTPHCRVQSLKKTHPQH